MRACMRVRVLRQARDHAGFALPKQLVFASSAARAQVALSHEFDPDFGGVLYTRDEWLIFVDAAGPVCLTAAHVVPQSRRCPRNHTTPSTHEHAYACTDWV